MVDQCDSSFIIIIIIIIIFFFFFFKILSYLVMESVLLPLFFRILNWLEMKSLPSSIVMFKRSIVSLVVQYLKHIIKRRDIKEFSLL